MQHVKSIITVFPGVEHDIRRLVRAQAEQREAGQKALLDAQRCIGELALQVLKKINLFKTLLPNTSVL